MYRRPSKKQQIIRRSLSLLSMLLSILVIVTATILFILGYRIDSINGRLEQGALVQFDSVPAGASVSIDGSQLSAQTPTKRSVIDGAHSFMVERSGYRPWAKSLNLEAGTLTWLDYIRLVPTDLKRETVKTFQTASAMKAAPDRQTLIVQTAPSQPTLERIDISTQTVVASSLTLPTALYSGAADQTGAHAFTLNEWDQGGRYVLVKHTYSDKMEWLVIDTEDVARSVNVTRLLSIELSDLQFAGTSGTILYGLTDGVIRRLDLSNATISRGLVTNVSSFELYQANTLTYIGTDPANATRRVAGLYRDGDAEPRVLRTASVTTPLTIDTTRHYNDDYVAIAEGQAVTLLKGRYPSSALDTSSLSLFATFPAPAAIDQVQFSPEGDYLIVQSGVAFQSYEVEYKRLNSATVDIDASQVQPLRWLDEAYVWAVYDGMLSMREFDGTNASVLMPAIAGLDATLSQNGRYLYALTQTDDTFRLERVTMILQ